jgi:outer membrane protein assembly factor BamB
LTFDEDLKGKFPFKRLPINLTGDSYAEEKKQRPMLLKRVAPKVPVVVFVTQKGKNYNAFVYTNGTWFQLTGEKPDDADTVRWAFTHIEPYLRRTFKGTTAEMKETLTDAISGKKKPPEPNMKEEPGVGPETEEKPKEKKDGVRAPVTVGPVFAVIPAVMVGGPLALLALLFPSVFGGWKRWLALISVGCTTSTIYFLHSWLAWKNTEHWWTSPLVYWLSITLVTVAGAFWAWQRHLHRLAFGEAPLTPGLVELVVLLGVSAFALGFVLVYAALGIGVGKTFDLLHHQPSDLPREMKKTLLGLDGLPVVVFCVGVWSGTLYDLVVRFRKRQLPALAAEVVMLVAMSLVATGCVFAVAQPQSRGSYGQPPPVAWQFKLPEAGSISSSPVVAGDRIFIAAAHGNAFPTGALYCLNRDTKELLWTFDNNAKMKQVFSTPTVAGDYVYIGEGFHQDAFCRLYCLKIENGAKVWEFQTQSHTESNPIVVDGLLYCGAGDDGLYCLDAKTGEKKWNFPGYHVDAGPLVVDGKVYCGAGVGDVFKETAFFCLDAKSGEVKWKDPTDLPVWSTASVDGGFVYLAMGNGRFGESDPNPAGAVLCVNAADGEEVWRVHLADAVLCRPMIDKKNVYVGCRDHSFYCLDRATGKEVWKTKLDSPVAATAALVSESKDGLATYVYVPAEEGQFYCLLADKGWVLWMLDVGENQSAPPQLFSSPLVDSSPEGNGRRRIYLATTLLTGTGSAGALVCYEEASNNVKE